jgi:hypothetical protein
MNYVSGIFIDFSFFSIQIWIWKTLTVFTGRYRYRTGAVKTVTGAVTVGIKNHGAKSNAQRGL